MRHVTVRLLAAPIAALAAAAVLIPAGSAQAAVVDHSTFSDVEEFSFDGCGFTIVVNDTRWGTYQARSSDLGWDLEHVVVHGRATYTNPQTGAWFSLRADTNVRDVDARLVGDDVLDITVRQAGAPFTLTDSSGQVVVRDRGLLVFRVQFDVSSGDLEYLGEEAVVDHGGHPGYFLDICDVATDLIG